MEGHCALWASNVPFVVWSKNKMCPLPALCSLITTYPARQRFTGLLNEVGIHKINNTHKVTQRHFHVMSIGGRLQGSYNTICCPQCRRRANTNKNYLYWALLLCVYCLSTRHHYTWPDLPGLSPPYLHTAKNGGGNGLGNWPGNEARATSTGAKINVQYTFRVVFLAAGTDLQWMQYSTALQVNSTTWLFQPIID